MPVGLGVQSTENLTRVSRRGLKVMVSHLGVDALCEDRCHRLVMPAQAVHLRPRHTWLWEAD